MCRSIRPLFNFAPPATEEEIRAAALQYVRKVSGSTRPSRENEAAFAEAVERITAITQELVRERLVSRAPPRTREAEAARAKLRGLRRERRAATAVASD
jgi:hypothetical protein